MPQPQPPRRVNSYPLLWAPRTGLPALDGGEFIGLRVHDKLLAPGMPKISQIICAPNDYRASQRTTPSILGGAACQRHALHQPRLGKPPAPSQRAEMTLLFN